MEKVEEMTPEIRKKLENNTTPFGLMEPELQEALREASADGEGLQSYIGGKNGWVTYCGREYFSSARTYRLAPSGLVIPDGLWELLDKKWVAIAKDEDGAIYPYSGKPKLYGAEWSKTPVGGQLDRLFTNLDPYDCDWRNSLVMRPGYEGSE